MRPAEARRIARLVRRAQHGDAAALEELVRRFAPLIRKAAVDEWDRFDEDLAQELYIEFLRLVDRFVPGGDEDAFDHAVRVMIARLVMGK